MRKNSWVSAGIVSCLISCLPEGHPPVEKIDTAQDTVDGFDAMAVATETDASADAELDMIADTEIESADIDVISSDKEPTFDADDVKSIVETEEDTSDTPPELKNQDAETIEEKVDSSPDDSATVIPGEDTVAIDSFGNDTVDSVGIDTIECPEGYYYDPEKGCVAFCGADKYFEKKIGKCLLYPCSGCDLNGQWELAVLDAESMTFTYYTLTMIQSVSYLKAQLAITSPPEVAGCAGTLENKDFTLSCNADEFTLVLTSETAASDEISGFYSYSYNDGKFKNGPCNLKKNN